MDTNLVVRPFWPQRMLQWAVSLGAISLGGCAAGLPSTQSPWAESPSAEVRAERASSTGRAAAGLTNPRSLEGRTRTARGQVRLASAEEAATTTLADADDPITDFAARSTLSERLKMPLELPGADAPPLDLPLPDSDQRASAIEALFPRLPTLSTDFRIEGAVDQRELSLANLEQLALENNPTIVQAGADIEAAAGAAIQAGAYPNPVVGYEADTVGSAGTRNYQGVFVEQEIKTAGKLDLARSIANVELMNRQQDLRKARAELLQKVRSNYFAVQVARENLRYSQALVRFTNEVYRVQVEQLKGGQAAAYEPMQLRALAMQARGAFYQARNRYVSAWKQLAAAVGEPNLPATPLTGRVDLPYRPIDYEGALSQMLTNNSQMLAARNLEFQKRLSLRLAEVTPIPNINVYTAIQKDFTTPPVDRTTYNVQFGVPVPVFNRNRGGIQQARGELVRAGEEVNRVRLQLTADLADAFERYEDNRILLDYYSRSILPDLARVYRGVYERHQQESDQVVFGDIIVAQQQLQQAIAAYVQAMNGQWDAYADVAALLQLEDLSLLPTVPEGAEGAGGAMAPEPLPPVEEPGT